MVKRESVFRRPAAAERTTDEENDQEAAQRRRIRLGHGQVHAFRQDTGRREFIIAVVAVVADRPRSSSAFNSSRPSRSKRQPGWRARSSTSGPAWPRTRRTRLKLERAAAKGKYARIAAISLATYWIEQGQPDKAQAALARIKDTPKDFFHYQAQDLSAQIAILKGEYDRAIAILKKIEDEKPKDYLLDAVLFHHAEALEKKGLKAGSPDPL